MYLFVDCGTNLGQGLNHFNTKFNFFNNPEWDIYTFEPNSYIPLDNMFKDVNNLKKIRKAVWINEDHIKFICKGKKEECERKKWNEERFQGGGSQLECATKGHEIPKHVETDYIVVEAINFSDFLKDNCNKYNRIVVKMDIEGAEFQIIDHLIENDTLKLITELYIETHGRFNFKMEEWDIKKKEINTIENELLRKCRRHIPNVHYWS